MAEGVTERGRRREGGAKPLCGESRQIYQQATDRDCWPIALANPVASDACGLLWQVSVFIDLFNLKTLDAT